LLYHNGTFLQVLEGPQDAVLGLVERIEKDPRNSNIDRMFEEEAPARMFSDWSMAYVKVTAENEDRLMMKGSFKVQSEVEQNPTDTDKIIALFMQDVLTELSAAAA
jgi:hypothetical protein